jgi:hypothetical protein
MGFLAGQATHLRESTLPGSADRPSCTWLSLSALLAGSVPGSRHLAINVSESHDSLVVANYQDLTARQRECVARMSGRQRSSCRPRPAGGVVELHRTCTFG